MGERKVKEDRMLTLCDVEPVYLHPVVQEHGLFLTTDYDGKVLQTSANSKVLFKGCFGEPQELLGRCLTEMECFKENNAMAEILEEAKTKKAWQSQTTIFEGVSPDMMTCQKDLDNGGVGEGWWENSQAEKRMNAYLDAISSSSPSSARISSRTIKLKISSNETMSSFVRVMPQKHGDRKIFLIEIIPLEEKLLPQFTEFARIQDFYDRAAILTSATSLDTLLDLAIQMVNESADFDRTIILQYDECGNSHVVREISKKSLDLTKHGAFLNYWFPAADIPKTARAILSRTRVRSVADVNSKNQPLVPPLLDGMPIDMSDAMLRSSSTIHLRYLRNMKVKASLSLSIDYLDKPWGMLCLHNYTGPKFVTPYEMMNMHTISSIFSTALEVVTARCENRVSKQLFPLIDELRSNFEVHPPKIIIEKAPELLQWTGSSHIFALEYSRTVDGITSKNIQSPLSNSAQSRKILLERFQNSEEDSPFEKTKSSFKFSEDTIVSSNLLFGESSVDTKFLFLCALEASITLDGKSNQTESGLLTSDCLAESCPKTWAMRSPDNTIFGISIARCLTSDILFLRGETVQNKIWAGTENLEKHVNQFGRLLPRSSFEAFNKIVNGRATKSTFSESHAMESIRKAVLVRAERTMEIERRRLTRIAKNFLASMSHEIRTPFNGIVGMINVLLEDQGLPAESREMLLTINRSTEAMLTILDDILVISKLEEGRLKISTITFDLFSLTEDVKKLFQVQCRLSKTVLEKKMISFLSRSEKFSGSYFSGDGGRIRQIVVNLVGNAVKFSQPEFGRVDLKFDLYENLQDTLQELRRLSKNYTAHSSSFFDFENSVQTMVSTPKSNETVYLLCSVYDNGIGIKPDEMHKLFQKFEQLNGGETKSYQGTGLGLAICRQLALALGGMIWCFSNAQNIPDVPHGSVFQVILPLQRVLKSDESKSCNFFDTSTFTNLQVKLLPKKHESLETKSAIQDQNENIDTDSNISRKSFSKLEQVKSPRKSENTTISFAQNELLSAKSVCEDPEKNVLPKANKRQSNFDVQELEDIEIALESSQDICLAAEDNEVNRLVLRTMFKRCNSPLKLCIMHGGDSTIEAYHLLKEKVKLLLLDYHMPGYVGTDILRILQQHGYKEPVYLITADTSLASSTFCTEHNINGVLTKPVTLKLLRSIVETKKEET